LHHEIAGEAGSRLDDNVADAIASDARQERREARTHVNAIGA
jgi:hypothetical protein